MIEIILTSSVLILLLVILRRALRGRISPCVQYALWLLVAARLLIPGTLFTAPVSVLGATEGLQTALHEAFPDPDNLPEPVINDSKDQLDQPQPAIPVSIEYPDKDTVVTTYDITAMPEITRRVYNWPDIIWKTGIAVTGGALVLSNLIFALRLRKNRKRLTLPDSPWSGDLPVYEMDWLTSPCLFGLFRPAIYLNEAAMDAQHPEHILAHEYAHYRHGDHVWAILRSVCLAIHWYNPLVWWAAALSRRDCELACDASALRQLGEDARIDYGQTLLGMVSRSRNPAAFFHTATTMTAGKRAMKERITLIVKQPRMRKITLAVVLLLTCLLAACSFGRAAEVPADVQKMPVAVSVGQSASSNLNDFSLITDPEEVKRLWELYQSFEYEGSYDPTGMGGWPVTVSFQFGDEPNDDTDIFFILFQHGIHTQDGEDLLLKDLDNIYTEFFRMSTSNPIQPSGQEPESKTPADLDPGQEILKGNARSIITQIQNGADTGEWLPLMNYMDWSLLRQAAVEAGMDDGDGSAAEVSIIGLLLDYVEENGPSMTAAQYLYILSATEGLDGAPAEGYGYMIYQMYERNPIEFAHVVLEMLPEENQNAVLDFFRTEWYYHRVSDSPDLPSREEAIAHLETTRADAIFAAPTEMVLYSAGSTFQLQVFNVSGIYALSYESSDPGVASVDRSGIVTANSPGTAVITAHLEGEGVMRDFICAVSCEWDEVPAVTPEPEPAEVSAESVSTEPPGELTNQWQQGFFGFVFEIPAMPEQELYDTSGDNLQTALSMLSSYYQNYVAQNGSSRYNDRFSRIIFENVAITSITSGIKLEVFYQVECLRDREYEGKTYTLAPQPGEHLSTIFTFWNTADAAAQDEEAAAEFDQWVQRYFNGVSAAPDGAVTYDSTDTVDTLYRSVHNYLYPYAADYFSGDFAANCYGYDVQLAFSVPNEVTTSQLVIHYWIDVTAATQLPSGEIHSLTLQSRELTTTLTVTDTAG